MEEHQEIGEQLHRERLLDLEGRLSRHRLRAFAVLAVGLLLSGPWLGWWWLLPLAAAALALALADRRLHSSRQPGRWVAAGWAISPLMIAVSVGFTGAAESPAIPWFALPALTLAARFERSGIIVGGAYIFALMALSTVALDPATVTANPTTLIFAVALTIAAMILSAAVVESDREHRRSAVVDPLTGLLNRTALAQRVAELEQQVKTADEDEPIGLLIGDLDHFKMINDEHGHGVGDAVLRDVAYALRGRLRAFDLVYRIGGEEFLVLLPGADCESAATIAESLRTAVATSSRPGVSLSMSFGAASDQSASFDFSRLYAEADAALYRAKRAGRDQVQVAIEGPKTAPLVTV